MLLSFVLLLYAIPRKSQALCRKFTEPDAQRAGPSSYNLSVCFADSSPSRGASGEEAKLYGLPRPPLARGGGIASAMTERASPSPGSRHAAMGRLFVRAMLSLRLLFFVSVLALSVTFGDSSPKGGASPYPPGTSSLRASSRRAVPSGRSLAASIWPGETW